MPRLRSLLLLLLAVPAAAQTFTASKFIFRHPGPASQAQLEATIGLHAGSALTRASMTAAAEKLADTGFYDNVGVTTKGSDNALTVVFDLTPADPASFLPTSFENFVWLSPDQIARAIRSKIPVYDGTLPEAGPQADLAAQALTEALAAEHVTSPVAAVGALPVTFEITHETVEPTLEHPVRVLQFRIEHPAPVVENVKLQGAAPQLAPLLQKAVDATLHTRYNEGKAGILTRDRLLRPLLDAGYAQALLSRMTLEIGSPAQGRVPLVLTATVTPGLLYKVGNIKLAPTPLVSAETFAHSAKLHEGDVASHAALLDTLKPLDAAYRSQGYMDVLVTATPVFNAAARTVDYTVDVVPGAQYRIHAISVEGLDAAAAAEFAKAFRLHRNDLFDAPYVNSFLAHDTTAPSLAPYNGTWRAVAHPETHTVDLVLAFRNSRAQ